MRLPSRNFSLTIVGLGEFFSSKCLALIFPAFDCTADRLRSCLALILPAFDCTAGKLRSLSFNRRRCALVCEALPSAAFTPCLPLPPLVTCCCGGGGWV